MSEIMICSAGKDQAESIAGLITREVSEALKAGLPATVLVGVTDGQAVGALGGAIIENEFRIESLFVQPGFRRQGVGRALMEKLFELFWYEEIRLRAEYTEITQDNETLAPFFEAMGFDAEPQTLPLFYITPLEDINVKHKIESAPGYQLNSFADTPDQMLRVMSITAVDEGYPLPAEGLLSPSVDRDLSFCVIHENEIRAYAAVEEVDWDMLSIGALWSDLSDPSLARNMLSAMVGAMKEKYSPDTRVAVLASSDVLEKIVNRISPGAKQCSRSYARDILL